MLYPEIQDISDGEEGDVIRIYVAARNESTDSQLSSEIEFRVDDESYDEDPGHISPGDYELVPPGETRFAEIIEWYSEEGEAGTHDITLRTTNQGNEVTEQFTLEDATTFEVEIEDVRGIELYDTGQQRVEVDWWVENNTGSGGTTDITLNVDDTQEDIESGVQFADSQERTGTLTWDAEGASIGEHDIEVATTDDSAGRGFVVEEEEVTEFDVVVTGDTETVRAGTDAEIEYTIARSGEGSASRDVWLVVNGTDMDRHEDVGLDHDEQKTDTLIWPTTNGDVGDTEVTVNVGYSSGIDEEIEGQDTETVTVSPADPDPQYVTDGFISMTPRDIQGSTTWDSEGDWQEYDERQNVEITSEGTVRLAPPPAPAFFDVYLASAIGTPEAGEEMNIGYGVRNTGDETDTTDVWLEIEGNEVDRHEDIELGENESQTGDLIWETSVGDAGSYEAIVRTEDDSNSVEFTVEPGEVDLPEGVIANYDAQLVDGSDGDAVSVWTDQQGDYDATASGDPEIVDDGINGYRSIDISDPEYFRNTDFDESQPTTIFAVIEGFDSGYVFSGGTDHHSLLYNQTQNTWRMNAGSTIDGEETTYTGPTLFTCVFDGSDSVLSVYGTVEGEGNVGSNPLDGLTISQRFSDDNDNSGGLFGQIVVCRGALSQSEIEEQESTLADKWGIQI